MTKFSPSSGARQECSPVMISIQLSQFFKQQLEIIGECIKFEGYKINIQESMFLYASGKQLENKI